MISDDDVAGRSYGYHDDRELGSLLIESGSHAGRPVHRSVHAGQAGPWTHSREEAVGHAAVTQKKRALSRGWTQTQERAVNERHRADQQADEHAEETAPPAKKGAGGKPAPGGFRIPAVEIFMAGTHRGKPYSQADLDDVVRNFERFSSPALQRPLLLNPAVIGHEEDQKYLERTDLPAAGWVERLWRDGPTLFADLGGVPAKVAGLLRGKTYRTVSAEIYDEPPAGIPSKGKMLRRVAFLGGEIPEVKGLAEIPTPEAYSEGRGLCPRVSLAAAATRVIRAGVGCWAVFSEVRRMSDGGGKPKRKPRLPGRALSQTEKALNDAENAARIARGEGSARTPARLSRADVASADLLERHRHRGQWQTDDGGVLGRFGLAGDSGLPQNVDPDPEVDLYAAGRPRNNVDENAEEPRTPRAGQRVEIDDPTIPSHAAPDAVVVENHGDESTIRAPHDAGSAGRLPNRWLRPAKRNKKEGRAFDHAEGDPPRRPRHGDRVHADEPDAKGPGKAGPDRTGMAGYSSDRGSVVYSRHGTPSLVRNRHLKDDSGEAYGHAEGDGGEPRDALSRPVERGGGKPRDYVNPVALDDAAEERGYPPGEVAGDATAMVNEAERDHSRPGSRGYRMSHPDNQYARQLQGVYNRRKDELAGRPLDEQDHAERPAVEAGAFARPARGVAQQRGKKGKRKKGGGGEGMAEEQRDEHERRQPRPGDRAHADAVGTVTVESSGWRSGPGLGVKESIVQEPGGRRRMIRDRQLKDDSGEAYDHGERGEGNGQKRGRATMPMQQQEQQATMNSREECCARLAERGLDPEMLEEMPDHHLMAVADAMDGARGPMEDDDEDAWPMPEDEDDEEELGRFREKAHKYLERAKKYAARFGELEDDVPGMRNLMKGKGSDQPGAVNRNRRRDEEDEEDEDMPPSKMSERHRRELQSLQKFHEEQMKAQKKGGVEAFIERMSLEGRLPPAQRESARKRLLRADCTTVIEKFSERGKTVELTELDLQMREMERVPSYFGEKFRQPKEAERTRTDADAELEKVQKFSETAQMARALEANGKTPADYVEEFRKVQKARKGAVTAAEYGVPEHFEG